MKTQQESKGITLMELAVVVGIIALLTAISLPAISMLKKSLGVERTPVRVLSSLLGSARARAVKEQRYAGAHFERTPGGKQYCIMIISEPAIPYSLPAIDPEQDDIPFVAVDGVQPVSLGKETVIASGADVNDLSVDIIYSPSGRLVRKSVMLCSNPAKTNDDIFHNTSGLFKTRIQGKMSDRAVSFCEESGVRVFYINTYTGEIINPKSPKK